MIIYFNPSLKYKKKITFYILLLKRKKESRSEIYVKIRLEDEMEFPNPRKRYPKFVLTAKAWVRSKAQRTPAMIESHPCACWISSFVDVRWRTNCPHSRTRSAPIYFYCFILHLFIYVNTRTFFTPNSSPSPHPKGCLHFSWPLL